MGTESKNDQNIDQNIIDENFGKFTLSFIKDTVILTGEIDDRYPQEFLDPFFDRVIAKMAEEVTIDIRELNFINSSGIKSLVNFLLKRKPKSKITILSSIQERWQSTSLSLLQNLDCENIIIKKG
jgi:anti-anti-sigma regulatory factor